MRAASLRETFVFLLRSSRREVMSETETVLPPSELGRDGRRACASSPSTSRRARRARRRGARPERLARRARGARPTRAGRERVGGGVSRGVSVAVVVKPAAEVAVVVESGVKVDDSRDILRVAGDAPAHGAARVRASRASAGAAALARARPERARTQPARASRAAYRREARCPRIGSRPPAAPRIAALASAGASGGGALPCASR